MTNGFVCRQCGNCCRVEGYVHLARGEGERIAAYLEMDADAFAERYTRPSDDPRSPSLTEKPDGSCVFLQPDNTCRINPVKPQQCRDFPVKWRFYGYRTICEGARHASR